MNLLKDDFIEVIKILEEREKCKVDCKTKCEKMIFSSDDNSELDLCISRRDNKFIIRRVALKFRRTGTFKILFNWFTDYCKRNNFKYIVLESIVSREMLSFAANNNFNPVLGKIIKDGTVLWGDYEYIIPYQD